MKNYFSFYTFFTCIKYFYIIYLMSNIKLRGTSFVNNTTCKRDEQLKQILRTLSEHAMDEQTYTQDERMAIMDTVLQLLKLWRKRL